jgi:hypothetical protein
MENVNIELSSVEDTLFINILTNGDFTGRLHYFPANLDERPTPDKMIEIWERFKGGRHQIPLDRMVYYLYKDEYKPGVVISGAAKFWQVLRMLYLLDKCSRIDKFEKLMRKEEQISKIKNIINKLGKKLTEEETKKKTIELYVAILSVISELEIVSILIENKFDIEFVDKKGARADIKFIKNGLTAELEYLFPYKSSSPKQDFITFERMIRDLLITSRKSIREDDLKKSDIIIINCMDLYYQQIFSNMLFDCFKNMGVPIESFEISPIKEAMERAFEIVNSDDNAIMLLFKGEILSREFRALVLPARFISSVKYPNHRRVYEVKDT